MKYFAGTVVGFLIATQLGFVGFLLGFGVTYLLVEVYRLTGRVKQLSEQIAQLDLTSKRGTMEARPATIAQPGERPSAATQRVSEPDAIRPEAGASGVERFPASSVEEPTLQGITPGTPERPVAPETPEPEAAHEPAPRIHFTQQSAVPDPLDEERPAKPLWVESAVESVRAFFLGGNTLVRVGIVVLFFGFVFLVKYAVENNFFPLELRLASAALGGMLMTAVGWRLRLRRPDVGLSLQGGGMAVLYLTVYATGRLYDLIPPGATLGLLLLVTACCTLLALLQNTQSLAVPALLGGFAAPLLASAEPGSHVLLFGFYGILNTGIAVLARYRSWRPLFLLGFFCTFGIGAFWGASMYRPDQFGTTEPFLVLFFLTYFLVSVFNSRHQSGKGARLVDGTLVFGLPTVVFSLQAGLVDTIPFGMAWTSLAFGLFYAGAAYLLFRRDPDRLKVLAESFAGIGLVLGSLILPFALDATWTGSGWALEGAALYWLGTRRHRLLMRLGGIALQLTAMAVFLGGLDLSEDGIPFLNAFSLGVVVFALGSAATAFLCFRNQLTRETLEVVIQPLFLALAMLWWGTGGILEIIRQFEVPDGLHGVVAFLSISGMVVALLRRRLDWPALRVPAVLIMPALALLLPAVHEFNNHAFAEGGFVAWPLALVACLTVLYLLESDLPDVVTRFTHGFWTLLLAAILISEFSWSVQDASPEGSTWPAIPTGLIPVAVAFILLRVRSLSVFPFRLRPEAYLYWGAMPLLAVAWVWSLVVTFQMDGSPAPLPYLPLLNPVDLTQIFLLLTAVMVYLDQQDHGSEVAWKGPAAWLMGATVFLWINASIGRTVHFYEPVPYTTSALFASTAFQTSLTVFWTTTAVLTMAFAARRASRVVWISAASLLGATVIKLFVIDLSSIGTVARIFTFLFVGILLLAIGYMAPFPPPKRGNDVPQEPTPV